MRFSRYNILSRQLSNGEYVLLNGMAGTLDLIDEEAYDLIKSHSDEEVLSKPVMDQMAEVREHFIERGYLTELSTDGELSKAEALAYDLIKKKENAKWIVVLLPSLGCNYRCTYCFEQNTGYPSITMGKKQVDAIFDIIKDKIESGSQLTLYGGEPLAKENREIIEYIIKKGKDIGSHFFTVTNGHDLDHYIDLIGKSSLSSFQITMDGPRDIHNRRRISLDKVSSYDKILSNIEKILRDTEAVVNLRINLDKRNAPHVMDFLEDLEMRGILNNPAFDVVANQVVGVGVLTLMHDDVRILEKAVEDKYPRFKDMFMGRTISSNDSIIPALLFGEPVARKTAVCGASSIMKLFCPDGKIYSCWSGLGRSDQVIGTFDEEGSIAWNSDVLEAWKQTMLPYNRECLGCRYAFLCAGGCHRPSLPNETSASSYECNYYKNAFEAYLARVADEYLTEGIE